MNYAQKPSMKDDILGFMRIATIDVYHTRVGRICLMYCFIMVFTLQLLQTCLFLEKFETLYFIQYAPMFMGAVYFLLSTATVTYSSNAVRQAFKNIDRWDVGTADSKTKEKILEKAEFVKTFFYVFFTLTVICGTAYAIPNPNDDEMIYFFMILKNYLPSYRKTLDFCCRLTFPAVAVIMATPVNQVIYFCKHIHFQMYLLHYYLESIDNVTKNKEILDETDQKEIRKRLVFCIERHKNIYIGSREAVSTVKNIFICFIVVGTLLNLSVLFFYVSFKNLLTNQFLRTASMTAVSLILSIYVVVVGQETETLSFKIVNILTNLKWYHWNKENQGTYLIFLMNASKPLRFEFSEKTSLNYKMGLKILNTIFSMVSVLSQVKSFQF